MSASALDSVVYLAPVLLAPTVIEPDGGLERAVARRTNATIVAKLSFILEDKMLLKARFTAR